jgi:hypothetical protein
MTDLATNVLQYGDNLDIDPPFNSNRDDNVIFRDESGNAAGSAGRRR